MSAPLKIITVGGVAAGMSAATRARRLNENASIIVLERGGYISFANCGLPYYLSGQIKAEQNLLVTTPDKVRQRFNIDARTGHEVIGINRAKKTVDVRIISTGQSLTLPYDKLILATGASPIIPLIDHVHAPNVFLLRSIEDTQSVQRFLNENHPHSVAIIGAGFIGLEMAQAMRERNLEVTLIEKAPHVLPPIDAEMALPIQAELTRNGVNLITGTGLQSLHAAENKVTHIELEDGRKIPADMVLLSIGVRPNTALAREAGLIIGATGAIAVDSHQRTSDADIYAVGDNSEVRHGVTGQPARIPLAGPANRPGRLAGQHAATGSAPAAGRSLGTAIVQVFDLAVGITGLSESSARAAGFNADSAYVYPSHHASYYPGARPRRIKLIYDQPTGKILGAQAVAQARVDKRIDIIATAIHFNGTIDDLAQLDLAYAPQFASAKDPIHQAAMVAQNQRQQLMPAISPAQLNGQQLVDVHTAAEFEKGSLPRAVNIPVDDLRNRLNELDPEKPTVAFCQGGQRGYVAQRILKQHGFQNVVNLKGGYSLMAGK
jgi:NADPH-dependent 2,4-dienoyl-CoA reductase/sulfur reductase-like enzyme/rhodanese-related sulfurtransferase